MRRFVRIVENNNKLESANNSNLGCSSGTDLVYDYKTKVVYYMFEEYGGIPINGSAMRVGYMSPYISENGKFCKFVANEIVEIS